jgi:hypothetical protein
MQKSLILIPNARLTKLRPLVIPLYFQKIKADTTS